MSSTEERASSQLLQHEVNMSSKKTPVVMTESMLKYTSLVVLVVQTTTLVLVMRYSRTMDGPKYLPSTAVLLVELLKILTCAFIVLHQNSWYFKGFVTELRIAFVDNYWGTIKIAVPACLYTIQNNLLYVALTNLDAATFQATYQLKILTTALFSVLLLRKKLIPTQWMSLVMLTVAVALVQWPAESDDKSVDEDSDEKTASGSGGSRVYGLVAILLACMSSGFSGVYFEKMLKGSDTSLWVRNIQLGLFGCLFALLGVFLNDYQTVRTEGFFVGYNHVVFTVIVLQAMGGLIVAAVIKYADNILKGFASAASIVLSTLLSYLVLQDLTPTAFFVLGVILVIASTFLYGRRPPTPSSNGNTSSEKLVPQTPYPPLQSPSMNNNNNNKA